MKGVPIKFRGKNTKSGEYVYGWYAEYFNFHEETVPYIVDEKLKRHLIGSEVEPDSICQLLGYDANGNEVYESDEVSVYHQPSFAKLNGDEELYGVYKARLYVEVGGEAIGDLNGNADYSFVKENNK